MFGTVATRQRVTELVRGRLKRTPDLKDIAVEQSVVGPIDADRVGVVWMARWRVDNPNYRPGAKP